MHIAELETPVPVVYIDRMEANITRLQTYLDEHRIAQPSAYQDSQNPDHRQNANGCRANTLAVDPESGTIILQSGGCNPTVQVQWHFRFGSDSIRYKVLSC